MSSDTTSISQLPSQDLSMQHGAPNQMYDQQKQQNVNMVINENTMHTSSMNQDRRMTVDEMNSKIQSMNSTLAAQPSQIPQSTIPHQTQQTSSVPQNEMGHLLSSINQLGAQTPQSSGTKLPIHQLQTQPTNIDQMSQVNYLNNGMHQQPNDLAHRLNDYSDNTHLNTNTGNIQERRSFYHRWFDELKIPLLICCLFFIFQMPFYKQNLHKHFNFLFQSDGNMNLYGYLTSSILFSVGYFILNKAVH